MKNKYTIEDFKGNTTEECILEALTAIANELHNIYTASWKMVENRKG